MRLDVLLSMFILLFADALGAPAVPLESSAEESTSRGLAVGMLPLQDGFTSWEEGEPGFHFRIEANRVFLFLLDEGGVIKEPDLHAASLLLVGQMNEGSTPREFLPLALDSAKPAYTAGRLVRPPHIFTATVFLFDIDQPEATRTVSFRYNAVADPEQPGTEM